MATIEVNGTKFTSSWIKILFPVKKDTKLANTWYVSFMTPTGMWHTETLTTEANAIALRDALSQIME